LNKSGGERRLNVAITRAKCNIKIVTSITSFDFNLTKTNSKGVKLLRDYIAFAENPCTEEDKSITDIDEDQESMEQFICTYLDQKNIQYKKRVGFSDYKIDIAIPCSQNPDHFLLAIETEGEQYVSARTERERYLTRHIMLKSMGWNVEHIWTPTLLQDTDREMKRLIRKIRTLDNNHTPFQQVTVPKPEDKPINNLRKDQDNQSQDFFDSPYCKIDEEDDKIPFGLKYYNITTFPDHEMQMRTCIQQVLHNESPIHIDLLCQRIAPKFDRKKVTKLFKDKVQQELEYIDYEYNKRSGFIYKNDASIQARIPSENNPETLRSIDHLPIEEIMIAIEAILKYSFSIPEDGLIDTVARVFGYNRTGEHIQKKLKHAIKKMYECNLIKATHENNVSLVYTESHP
jgi:very-short-patch-repair endonuclease